MKKAVHGTDKERKDFFLFSQKTMQDLRKEKKAKSKPKIKQGVWIVGERYYEELGRFVAGGGDLSECPF